MSRYSRHRSATADFSLAVIIGAGLAFAIDAWVSEGDVCVDYSRVMGASNAASKPVLPAHSLARRPLSEAFAEPPPRPESGSERGDNLPPPPRPHKRANAAPI